MQYKASPSRANLPCQQSPLPSLPQRLFKGRAPCPPCLSAIPERQTNLCSRICPLECEVALR